MRDPRALDRKPVLVCEALHPLAHPGLPTLTTLLGHPLLGDTARFALTPEAATLCQRMGSAWAR